MNKSEPGWEFYRSFLAVIREGSLSGAARVLGLTQPTVGRHIDALEDSLGVSLFTRSQNGLSPTESALSLMPHADAMASAADALRRAATGAADEERGTVRLTASEIIGTEVLPPMLTAARMKHPLVEVEMVISNRNTDLLRREADIAIRMAQPTQSALVARKVGTVHLGFHAHPSYAEKYGLPTTIEELSEHPVIGYDRNASIRRLDHLDIELTRDFFSYRCDSDVAQYAMLKAGYGVGVCQYPLGARDGLIPFMPEAFDFPLDIWVVMHEDLRGNRRMRLMFDHLAESLGAYARSAGAPAA